MSKVKDMQKMLKILRNQPERSHFTLPHIQENEERVSLRVLLHLLPWLLLHHRLGKHQIHLITSLLISPGNNFSISAG